ncbi:MAG: alpha/beta fold hydrolase [Chloroflexi bacterium]|nr:alpha/beta fold hydrolase [Chloroflexota bacterium]
MPTVALRAGTVNYAADGDGPPLLLLHSVGTSNHLWGAVIPLLAKRYSVLAPDFLGHGDSDRPPREFTIADHADASAEFMEQLGFREFAVAGTSMGAIVAIDLAHRYSDRVTGLVLNGCPGWHLESQRLGRVIATAGRIVGQDGLPKVDDIGGTVRPAAAEELQRRRADLKKCGRWFVSSLWAIAAYDLATRLPGIRCPALVLMGEADFHLGTSYALADGIPRAMFRMIADAGHLTPYDDPAGVAAQLDDFYQRVLNTKEVGR